MSTQSQQDVTIPSARANAVEATDDRPKILLGTMNHADMPMSITRALKRKGYTAEHIQYTTGKGHALRYELDNEVDVLKFGGRIAAQTATLKDCLEREFDIFHFWNRSLFYSTNYSALTGFDIPLLKSRGRKIVFRFTGFDLRLPSWDREVNRHSPFHHGYRHLFDEEHQKAFLNFIKDYADRLVVQDPEMAQFCPEAEIIPRALNLGEWEPVGVEKSDRPLIVHAPTFDRVKGTSYVLKAIETLQEEGLSFEFKLIQGMPHAKAREWYRKADIIVDQLLIGATGVLTLEGWALGKPVVVYLREDLFEPFYKTRELPVANANPETVTDVLRRLIKDYDERAHLSKAGRKTVEEFHDIDNVIEQYLDLYHEVHRMPPKQPRGTADVDLLSFHARRYEISAQVVRQLGVIEPDSVAGDVSAALLPNGRTAPGREYKFVLLEAILPRMMFWPIKGLLSIRQWMRRVYFGLRR